MNLTIEVMLPPRGATDFGSSANSTWRVLTPVAVYTLRQPLIVGMPNTGYIHVTGVPVPAAWAGWTEEQIIGRINAILCEVWNAVERRQWQGDASLIPSGAQTTLLVSRQITVTWTQFKAVMKNLVTLQNLVDTNLT